MESMTPDIKTIYVGVLKIKLKLKERVDNNTTVIQVGEKSNGLFKVCLLGPKGEQDAK